jgi:T-complex protein 1 subunit beta
LISRLRAELNSNPQAPLGIDVENGTVGNMQELKVVESFRVKEHALLSAHEAAEQILRVDEILKNEPRKRDKPYHC